MFRHDFARKHGGQKSQCNGQGLMSYGNPPDKWSECSNKDFTEYWRKEGFTCIKSDDMGGGAMLDQCVTRCSKQTCAPDVSTKVGSGLLQVFKDFRTQKTSARSILIP